jgi:hypothetical protein
MTPILRERDHLAKSKDAIKKKWWLKKIHRWNPWWTTRDTTVPKTILKHLSKLVYFVMFSSTFYNLLLVALSFDASWSWHVSPHHDYSVLQSAWRFRWILERQTFTSPCFGERGKACGILWLGLWGTITISVFSFVCSQKCIFFLSDFFRKWESKLLSIFGSVMKNKLKNIFQYLVMLWKINWKIIY